MDGVCLNDNSRNLGGGGSTPRHVPSPIKTYSAGDSHLRAMAPANRNSLKVGLPCPPFGTGLGTPYLPQKRRCLKRLGFEPMECFRENLRSCKAFYS